MSLDRVRKEHEAQRARATAMRHLSETGSGPSYQEQLREENARSKYKNKVSQFITQQYPESSLMTVDPRIRDNTLQVIAQRNAKALSTSNSLSDREQYYTKEELMINSNCKTSKQVETWKEAFDSESGQKYFWNEKTNETRWEPPSEKEQRSLDGDNSSESDVMSDWQALRDSTTNHVYYWNKKTHESTWTLPNVPVSNEKALNAMSKLDKILEQCGQTNPEKLNPCSETETEGKGQHDTSTQILSENSGTGQDISVKISQVLPAATRSLITSENAPRSVSPSVRTNSVEHNASNKKRPRSRKENSKVDPLDPTAGRGKWADALFSQGEYAADTTANGPLYQQRPYLAPGKILRKETKRKR